MRSWPELKSGAQLTETPRCPIFNFYSFLRERGRQRDRETDRASEGEAEREGDKESAAGPRFWAVITDPDQGSNLWTVRSWLELTEPLRHPLILLLMFPLIDFDCSFDHHYLENNCETASFEPKKGTLMFFQQWMVHSGDIWLYTATPSNRNFANDQIFSLCNAQSGSH